MAVRASLADGLHEHSSVILDIAASIAVAAGAIEHDAEQYQVPAMGALRLIETQLCGVAEQLESMAQEAQEESARNAND